MSNDTKDTLLRHKMKLSQIWIEQIDLGVLPGDSDLRSLYKHHFVHLKKPRLKEAFHDRRR